ncbi:hypothetical protein SNEBB_009846 [Seison nebaliae]|nr:hypothetical protein SNEBB_009846 [Seison nebaliae]
MGERKGQNKYYPPDFDPKKHGNLNNYHGTHALRDRAKKIHQGIIEIRFEMPYNVWCLHCKAHIGMGVRYTCDKKKIGMYYSSPIFQFDLKCHLCKGLIEIKTDPETRNYIIVSGARRDEERWDPKANGQIELATGTEQMKLATNAMYRLEHKTRDTSRSEMEKVNLWKLKEIKDLPIDSHQKLHLTAKELLNHNHQSDDDETTNIRQLNVTKEEAKRINEEDGEEAKKLKKIHDEWMMRKKEEKQLFPKTKKKILLNVKNIRTKRINGLKRLKSSLKKLKDEKEKRNSMNNLNEEEEKKKNLMNLIVNYSSSSSMDDVEEN